MAVSKVSRSKTRYIKSPLNYVGGKYRLLNQLIPHFPEKIDTFYDLFSGGANVGINIEASHYVFNDMNYHINDLFRYLQEHSTPEVIDEIEATIQRWGLSKTNQEAFIAFREHYNEDPNPLDLYVLSSFSYNYQIRFNNDMKYNNPFGRNRSSFSTNMRNNLIRFSERLKSIDAVFTDQYFEDVDLSILTTRDFVYIDPPYLITTGSYNDGARGFKNWDMDSELGLLKTIDYLTNHGIPVALSNVIRHKGRVNTLLEDFVDSPSYHTYILDHNYDNSSHNSKMTGSMEVLVTNYCLTREGSAVVT